MIKKLIYSFQNPFPFFGKSGANIIIYFE